MGLGTGLRCEGGAWARLGVWAPQSTGTEPGSLAVQSPREERKEVTGAGYLWGVGRQEAPKPLAGGEIRDSAVHISGPRRTSRAGQGREGLKGAARPGRLEGVRRVPRRAEGTAQAGPVMASPSSDRLPQHGSRRAVWGWTTFTGKLELGNGDPGWPDPVRAPQLLTAILNTPGLRRLAELGGSVPWQPRTAPAPGPVLSLCFRDSPGPVSTGGSLCTPAQPPGPWWLPRGPGPCTASAPDAGRAGVQMCALVNKLVATQTRPARAPGTHVRPHSRRRLGRGPGPGLLWDASR